MRNKSFLFYLIGQAVSSLGDGFYLVAFMWLAMKLSGGSGFLVDAFSLRGVFLGVSVFILMGALIGFVLPGFEEPESKIGFGIQEKLQN